MSHAVAVGADIWAGEDLIAQVSIPVWEANEIPHRIHRERIRRESLTRSKENLVKVLTYLHGNTLDSVYPNRELPLTLLVFGPWDKEIDTFEASVLMSNQDVYGYSLPASLD